MRTAALRADVNELSCNASRSQQPAAAAAHGLDESEKNKKPNIKYMRYHVKHWHHLKLRANSEWGQSCQTERSKWWLCCPPVPHCVHVMQTHWVKAGEGLRRMSLLFENTKHSRLLERFNWKLVHIGTQWALVRHLPTFTRCQSHNDPRRRRWIDSLAINSVLPPFNDQLTS